MKAPEAIHLLSRLALLGMRSKAGQAEAISTAVPISGASMMAQVEYSKDYELRGKDREENADPCEHNLRLYRPRRAGPHAPNKSPAERPAGFS